MGYDAGKTVKGRKLHALVDVEGLPLRGRRAADSRLKRRRIAMTEAALAGLYRAYIVCLIRQDWDNLGEFVADDARHNGRPFGLIGYRAMLERDFAEIPDLRFNIELLVCKPPNVASRLASTAGRRACFSGSRSMAGESSSPRMFSTGSPAKNRGGVVGDRQGGDRGAALTGVRSGGPLKFRPASPGRAVIIVGRFDCGPTRRDLLAGVGDVLAESRM